MHSVGLLDRRRRLPGLVRYYSRTTLVCDRGSDTHLQAAAPGTGSPRTRQIVSSESERCRLPPDRGTSQQPRLLASARPGVRMTGASRMQKHRLCESAPDEAATVPPAHGPRLSARRSGRPGFHESDRDEEASRRGSPSAHRTANNALRRCGLPQPNPHAGSRQIGRSLPSGCQSLASSLLSLRRRRADAACRAVRCEVDRR